MEQETEYPKELDEFQKWFLSEIADTVQIEDGDDAPERYKLCVAQISRNLWEQNKQLKSEIECMKNRLTPLKIVCLGEESGHAD
jgi:hypothetical protein